LAPRADAGGREHEALHELSIAIQICRAVAERAEGRRVASIDVEVGALSGVSADALDFCISEIAKAEGLGEPRVRISEAPAALKCECGEEYTTTDLLKECPSCGGYEREIISGMDIMIRACDLEDETK